MPILENTTMAYRPHLKKHINKLERSQRVATKLVHSVRNGKGKGRVRKGG